MLSDTVTLHVGGNFFLKSLFCLKNWIARKDFPLMLCNIYDTINIRHTIFQVLACDKVRWAGGTVVSSLPQPVVSLLSPEL